MATLYVSDLDGTLLDREGHLSSRTRAGLVEILDRGVDFTIATARSVVSLRERVDLPLPYPVVCANGAFLDDAATGRHLHVTGIDRAAARAIHEESASRALDVVVVTWSEREQIDRMFVPEAPTTPTQAFLEGRLRHRDPRIRQVPADEVAASIARDVTTSLVFIDRTARLAPLADHVLQHHADHVAVHLNDDYYLAGYQWLTIHAAAATKGHGVQRLRETYAPHTDRLVVFGDETNDLPMFRIADHAVATQNAVATVKEAAHEVIGLHHEDAVIDWLLRHA